jgi:hypothetical protein
MQTFFSKDLGQRHTFVLHGLGGSGKSQIAFKFIQVCRTNGRFVIPTLNHALAHFKLYRFSDVYFIDATSAETITMALKDIALAKGVGDSDKDVLDWLSGLHEEWLLLFDNADNTMLDLHNYFPTCTHGNIIITSRNRETCIHATELQAHYHVSGLENNEAIGLLFKVAHLDHESENAVLAAILVKVG